MQKQVSKNPYRNALWALVDKHNIGYFEARSILDDIFTEKILNNPDYEKIVIEKMKSGVFHLLAEKRRIYAELVKARHAGEVITSKIK